MSFIDQAEEKLSLLWTQLGLNLGFIDSDTTTGSDELQTPVVVQQPDSAAMLFRLQQVGLPDSYTPYLPAIAGAAIANLPNYDGLDAYVFALVLCGLISRESGVGELLSPSGSAGVGDLGPRWKIQIPDWCSQDVYTDCVTGNTKPDSKGRTLHEIQPPAAFGAQERGWGYGIAQLDFASYWQSSEFASGWTDPVWHVNEAARHLCADVESLASLSAGISAYNCGRGGARSALALGLDPDSKTTNKNYGMDVIRRANKYGAGVTYSSSGG